MGGTDLDTIETGADNILDAEAETDVAACILHTPETSPGFEKEELTDTDEEVLGSGDEFADTYEETEVYALKSENEVDLNAPRDEENNDDDDSHDVDVHLIRGGPSPRDPLFEQSSSDEEEE